MVKMTEILSKYDSKEDKHSKDALSKAQGDT